MNMTETLAARLRRDSHRVSSDCGPECLPCEDTKSLARQLDAAEATVVRLTKAVLRYEEREAAVCPEDVSFEEVIADLRQQVEVLRPGGMYAWKQKCEQAEARATAAETERDEALSNTWEHVVKVGRMLLDRHYASDVFDGSSGDVGPAYIVALRQALAAVTAREEPRR